MEISEQITAKQSANTIRPNSYKKRSSVWLHFDLCREKSLAGCHYCERNINYNLKSGTTSNLLKHLNDHHPEYLDEAIKARYQPRIKVRYEDQPIKFEPTMKYEQSEAYESEGPMFEMDETAENVASTPMNQKQFDNQTDDEQVYIVGNAEDLADSQYEIEYVEESPLRAPRAPPVITKPELKFQRLSTPPIAKKRPNPVKTMGFMDTINQRLDRIERKVDLLLNYLVGDNYELGGDEEEETQPVMKKKKVQVVMKSEAEMDDLSE